MHIALSSPNYLVIHNGEGIGHADVDCAKDNVYAVTHFGVFSVWVHFTFRRRFGISARGPLPVHVFFYLRLQSDSESRKARRQSLLQLRFLLQVFVSEQIFLRLL